MFEIEKYWNNYNLNFESAAYYSIETRLRWDFGNGGLLKEETKSQIILRVFSAFAVAFISFEQLECAKFD